MRFETPTTIERIALRPPMRIHLVGIGGFGLSAIARVLLGKGFEVSGSDQQLNTLTTELTKAGAKIFEGHHEHHSQGADVVLVSSAIPVDNVEIMAAQAANIPVLKRADFLRILMADSFGIAVTGTHGKTTTTGMIAQIMMAAGLDPTFIVGGVLPAYGCNGRAGKSKYFVIEADEYDYMFLGLKPQLAVVTNIDYDHPDLYVTVAEYEQAFRKFMTGVPDGGRLVVCSDDPTTTRLAAEIRKPGLAIDHYGFESGDWRAVDLRLNQLGGMDFLVQKGDDYAGLIRLRIPGMHNVLNALAAIAATAGLGIGYETIRLALAEFGGVGRRFQVIGEIGDVIVIDDYAHHPTEIRATLAAARQRYANRRIWAVWQPHTYSRTKRLLSEFATSFVDADRVVALDVYRSRETDTLGVGTASVLAEMEYPEAHHVGDVEEAAAFLLDRIRPGDVIITMTAGDGYLVGEIVLRELGNRLPGDSNQRDMPTYRSTTPVDLTNDQLNPGQS